MDMPVLNWIDYIVITLLALSTIVGLMRGFLKEVISLLTWIVAFAAAVLFSGRLAHFFSGTSGEVSLFSIGMCFIAIFLGVLILGKIINFLFSRAADTGGFGFLNPILGAIFGLARGFLFVILMMFLIDLTAYGAEPYWKDSYFVNVFEPSVQWIGERVEPGYENLKAKVGQTLKEGQEGTGE